VHNSLQYFISTFQEDIQIHAETFYFKPFFIIFERTMFLYDIVRMSGVHRLYNQGQHVFCMFCLQFLPTGSHLDTFHFEFLWLWATLSWPNVDKFSRQRFCGCRPVLSSINHYHMHYCLLKFLRRESTGMLFIP